MRELSDVVRFVGAQPPMLELLRAVASLALPDGWMAALTVRGVELLLRSWRSPFEE